MTTDRWMVFKIRGLKETVLGDAATIVLRLKADHSKVFARMRVHVFEPRTIPVSIYRVWDSRKTSTNGDNFTKVIRGLTDEQIIAELNKTYQKQAGITFRSEGSREVDVSQPVNDQNEPLEPVEIFNDTQLDDLNSVNKMIDLTQKIHGKGFSRLAIHILETYVYQNAIGVGDFRTKSIIINSYATGQAYAHEAGHCLGAGTKATGNQNKHDKGPWPREYLRDRSTGLMYDNYHNNMKLWLREDDWAKSAETAKFLK